MEYQFSQSHSLDSSKTLDDENVSPNSHASLMSLSSADLFNDDSESTFDYYWPPSYFFDYNPPPLPTYVGAGLENLGNTCFLNAVLQCFIYTVPLLQGFLYANCDCKSGGFCLLCVLRELVELCLTSADRVVSPHKLVDNLSYFSSSFQRYHQEDAHEFLQSFLDRLESCCEVKRCDNPSSQRDNLVKQVFGGCLVSKLKCSNCGHCSDTFEPLVDLSLEIEDADNLLTALQSFTKVEKIEDADTKFTCEGCKEQVSIEKQLALYQIPPVASFHLKRFKYDGSFVEKIDKHVAFPKELDLLPFTGSGNTSDVELKYILYAVVVHSGFTPTSGHYYSMVRLSQDMWCKFNDSRVSVVSEDFVLAQEAYILFYAKEGTSWFMSFIDTQNSCLSSTILSTSPKSVLDNVETSSYSSDLQEKTSIDTNTVSDLSGSRHFMVDSNEIDDSGTKHNEIGSNESNDWICNLVDPAYVSSDVSPKVNSPTLLDKATWTQETNAGGIINPQTLKSPSQELIRENPPDAGFSVPHNHLKLVDRVSCKRKLEKGMDDDKETRQACQLIKKSTPGSRKKQLLASVRVSKSKGHANIPRSRKKRPLATVRGSKSEGHTNKKSSTGLSQSRNDRNTPTQPRLSVGQPFFSGCRENQIRLNS